MTYAPETFKEYFNQRRRWIPSTMANLIDFILDYKHILKTNARVTIFYVIYIFVNFIASLLGPSTIVLMIADTLNVSFELNTWLAYSLAVSPGVFYVWVCLKCKTDAQIKVGAVLSSFLGVLMVAILVGALARLLNQSPVNPSSLILYTLVIIFLIAGILHPREFKCLFPGILYFISLPAAFILLNIYSFANLNNVSWGTREIAKKQTANNKNVSTSKSKPNNLLNRFLNQNNEPNLATILDKLDDMEKRLSFSTKSSSNSISNQEENLTNEILMKSNEEDEKISHWHEHECLKEFKNECLNENESLFFFDLIQKYLLPLNETKEEKERALQDLDDLRDKCYFSFLILNVFWIVLLFVLVLLKHKLQDKIYFQLNFGKTTSFYEPVQFLFIMMFVVLLVCQLFGMLWHRAITFMQLIRMTNLKEKKILKDERNGHAKFYKISEENLGFEMNADEVKNAYLCEVQQATIHLDDETTVKVDTSEVV